jgi:hypothetical protein
MVDCLGELPVPAIIHGGGWEPYLGKMQHVTLEGFQPYHESARLILSSLYSLCLHEPIGEKADWVTARWFENLGCQVVNFTDRDYAERVLPREHPLRVGDGEELREKILERSYEEWVSLQTELINPDWLNWRSWFYLPFRRRLRE